MTRGLKEVEKDTQVPNLPCCTDCPDDKGTESVYLVIPALFQLVCCTDCPDDKGTESLQRGAKRVYAVDGCTDCPDDKGTESNPSHRFYSVHPGLLHRLPR